MDTISDTQRAILDLIADRIEADGMPPSQVEIAKAFGFKGVRAAQYHLEALEAAGAIERVPGRARGIRIKRLPESAPPPVADDDSVRLPVLGEVAAGMPIEAGIDYGSLPETYIVLDRVLFSPKPDYLLK